MQRRRTCHAQATTGCVRGWPWAASALWLLTGCIVDDDKKCGANQVESDVAHVSGCICAPNSIPNADGIGCTLCGDNASVQNGACACNTGFARVSEGGACVVSQLGAPCTTAAQCTPAFPVCAAGGYCTTSGCTGSEACPGGYTCDTAVTPAYCRRPATGQGTACTPTGNECASFDAKYCALSPMGGGCVVSGCKTVKGRCDVGYSCCDLTGLGLTDMCIGNASLVGGKCPGLPGMMMDPVVVP